MDLKRRTLAPRPGGQPSLAGQILGTFTSEDRLAACDGCLSRDVCPMRRNAEMLRGPAQDRGGGARGHLAICDGSAGPPSGTCGPRSPG